MIFIYIRQMLLSSAYSGQIFLQIPQVARESSITVQYDYTCLTVICHKLIIPLKLTCELHVIVVCSLHWSYCETVWNHFISLTNFFKLHWLCIFKSPHDSPFQHTFWHCEHLKLFIKLDVYHQLRIQRVLLEQTFIYPVKFVNEDN